MALAAELPPAFPFDPAQVQERTCFQTGQAWSGAGNLRSDVAIVYGIDAKLPERIATWRNRGYRIHVMTGVSWGHYQDYLYGRFDGVNHEDEAQTERNGKKISHGGDVYYMCPGTNFGKFLSVGVQRALEAGAEAIHLEEPEFWVRAGYSEGFRREWKSFYGEEWLPPHASVDAQWRASKLKYFLYRRALQQVFDHVNAFNDRTGKHVRCYVPTHSLLNYAHWNIVSPESSLARLRGCDGYIAQVWTGTSRTPNVFRGVRRERTFETAFLEYGAMQNLVRATGRTVWYLNDPIEDNPDHDWTDYRTNWESTLVASLFQPEVSQFEVAPWPERIFNGRYPANVPVEQRQGIPAPYATELQVVMNALNELRQPDVDWHGATTGVGLLVSDSLMFQRGEPTPSDGNLSHVYGLALPFLKRGVPIQPVQLENLTVPHALDSFRVLLLSYHGQKPLTPDVHPPLAEWVRGGGTLVVCDDDADPYNRVRDWWNTDGRQLATPREHLFAELGWSGSKEHQKIGAGQVLWLKRNPAQLAGAADGDAQLVQAVKAVAPPAVKWQETNHLLLRRGPYLVAAGLDESVAGASRSLQGRFVSLFDPELRVQTAISLTPGSRHFLLDLERVERTVPRVLAAACKTLPGKATADTVAFTVEGVPDTGAVVLLHSARAPKSVRLAGASLSSTEYLAAEKLLRLRFPNTASPRELVLEF